MVKIDFTKNVSKTKTTNEDDKIYFMKRYLLDICEELSISSDKFNEQSVNRVIKKLQQYMDRYDRIIYHVFSDYVFENENIHGTLATNLDFVIESVLKNSYKQKYIKTIKRQIEKKFSYAKDISEQMYENWIEEEEDKQYNNMKKTILKLYDHINLAIHQYSTLKESDKEFGVKIMKHLDPVKNEVDKKMNDELSNFSSSFTSQLLAIIGIFTAMSFMVFGSLDSLGGIFENITNAHTLKTIIFISLWGLCISNLIFVFMYFIGRLVKATRNEENNYGITYLLHKKLVCLADLILVTVLAISSWLYFVDFKDVGSWFVNIVQSKPILSSGIVIGVIILFFVGGVCWIFKDNLLLKEHKVKESDDRILQGNLETAIDKADISC
ncbi:hypothetical protein PMW00_11365 [Clostridium paraputrificum]|uniref:hypothetical protein n=1 Tax=Clostridium paraputrificum TaxID=29363 RepID=UPI00232D3817|nr:hypothetical protein [Clostridium paraputrificum]MDB2103620.1 hypothetical protein [Clostridium paraputrificum]